ncbi:MAG: dihydrofolate reductase [Prevotellaceae bacterium]|jgi:dihydrofolate reductase|nr:dihydrofolate reductase [Prevotellaceae bacterium]
MLAIIVAVDENNAIGKDNKLLWHITEDLKYFKIITNGHPVIMGRKTFESIGRALPGRTNIIISRNPRFTAAGCRVVASLDDAIAVASDIDENQFIIGGASIYREAVGVADTIYLTVVHNRYDADTFFPEISKSEWDEVERIDFERGKDFEYSFSFLKLKKIQYLKQG